MNANDRSLPLHGVTVLDLGQIYQGPYAGFLLAMAGARVIKIEQTRGEPLRARGDSLPYATLNSSKEAVTLDLKSAQGHEMFLGLVEAADVVLVNYAPGVPEKLHIDAESLWKVNPKLVFAHAYLEISCDIFCKIDIGASALVPSGLITVLTPQ